MKKMRLLIPAIACCLIFQSGIPLRAQEQENQKAVAAEDKIIAALLKVFAGAYVKTSDIGKLKEKQIRRLEQMNDEDFSAEYERVFSVIRECPQFRKNFGLYEGMSKEQFIVRVSAFDRKQICGIINSIPDEVLSGKFREYLSERGEADSGAGITQQVSNVWAKIKAKAEGPAGPLKTKKAR
ncbi:MAG: hypothetical protein WC335_05690 [Candidatus Omnitrophota bacterium]|jgi:hypothetical protein